MSNQEQHKLISGTVFFIAGERAGEVTTFRETIPVDMDNKVFTDGAECANPDALYEVTKSRIITEAQRQKMDDADLLQ